ncbi:DNA polymerase III subunit delta [Spiroplasma endosymbiont of Crioceris asparagi]|uniref:DNA polymerase III subunit delta n=1 Tax=Spiroplasma endosymbiont of Crioceris asparagi TaxID=3066286 RepID=UPI0030CF2FAE
MFLVNGYDNLIIKKQINKLITTIGGENEVLFFDCENLNFSELELSVSNYSFFNNKKIIVLNNINLIEKNNDYVKKRFEKFLKIENIIWIFSTINKFNKSILKIIEGLNVKIKKIELKEMNQFEIKKNIISKLKRSNVQFNEQAVDYFLEYFSNDFNVIKNEIKKFIDGEIEFNQKNIDLICINNEVKDIFQMSQIILNNDIKAWIENCENYINKNKDLFSLLKLICDNLIILRNAILLKSENFNESQIASKLNIHPYRLKIILKNNFNNTSMVNINDKIKMITEIQKGILTGKYDNISIQNYEIIKLLKEC